MKTSKTKQTELAFSGDVLERQRAIAAFPDTIKFMSPCVKDDETFVWVEYSAKGANKHDIARIIKEKGLNNARVVQHLPPF